MKNISFKKYYLFIIVALGFTFFSIAYADLFSDTAAGNVTTTQTATSSNNTSADTQAYNALTQAQADAVANNAVADEENRSEDYLKRIAVNTYAFLKAFNAYSLNWLQIYNTPTSNELGSLFDQYMYNSEMNIVSQLGLLSGENSIYALNYPDRAIYAYSPPRSDLTYATLIKQNTKDSTGKLNPVPDDIKLYAKMFVKNASAVNVPHISPSGLPGGGNEDAVKKYTTFYNTISAITSYNGYILNAHLADLQNNFNLTQTQMDLKNYASSSDWIKHVNEEQSIGVILRQMLLFTSQMYIVSLQSLETQKELLAAIAMTNSLVILGNSFNENALYEAAKPKR